MNRGFYWKDQIVVITGATSGIGLAAAQIMAQKGAVVIGVGRSQQRCKEAGDAIKKMGAQIHYLTADLSSLKQIRQLAVRIREVVQKMGKDHIDVLVNNAGTFSSWYVSTAEGFELQFAVNHLAPFLLTSELMPLLENSKAGKVMVVSSGSHYGARMHWKDVMLRRHYNGLIAYKQSKLANVLFAKEFNRIRGQNSSLRAFAIDPGLVNTDIGCKGTTGIEKWIWEIRKKKGTSPEVPAACITGLVENLQLHDAQHVYWKDGKPRTPSRYSQRDEAARRLWELSEKLCGIKGH